MFGVERHYRAWLVRLLIFYCDCVHFVDYTHINWVSVMTQMSSATREICLKVCIEKYAEVVHTYTLGKCRSGNRGCKTHRERDSLVRCGRDPISYPQTPSDGTLDLWKDRERLGRACTALTAKPNAKTRASTSFPRTLTSLRPPLHPPPLR